MYISLGHRVNAGYLATYERKVLNWLCKRVPQRIIPDHLTALGILGAFITFAGYVCSRFDPAFFWLASFGLLVHWFGDSLDGSLARYRGRERARYGYFLDCMTDAFCCLVIMFGLGLSPYVSMDAALFSLVGYYMLCMYVFLNHHLNGIHRLSFVGCSPTEMRLSLIVANTWMFFYGQYEVGIFGAHVSIYNVAFVLSGLVSIVLFVRLTMKGIEDLGAREGAERVETSKADVTKSAAAVLR